MPKAALNGVFQRIRTLAAVRNGAEHGDRELLERFLAGGDEAAFTVLVERHGPMVLGVCRRLLHDKHDAEDTCQATFLVLARRGRSLRKQASLASWLHGVAYRLSVNFKRQQARRRRREQAVVRPLERDDDAEVSWRDLRTALDEELLRLPERQRAPLVLCYLEGKTRDEAAAQLHTTPGALHGQLERGRTLLRQRLIRRGLTLSAALMASALGNAASATGLAPGLVVAASRAAAALAQGRALGVDVVAPQVLSLVQEASKMMLFTKLKVGAAVVVAAALLTGLGAGSFQALGQAQEATAVKFTLKPPGAESDQEFIRRLSLDLRGAEPTPAEVHFFVGSKETNRRQRLIDLFIQEREVKQRQVREREAEREREVRDAQKLAQLREAHYTQVLGLVVKQRTAQAQAQPPVTEVEVMRRAQRYLTITAGEPRFATIQAAFYGKLLAAAKEKKDVAGITQQYLDQLLEYAKTHPKNEDVADAMLHITLVYGSQGKKVEADAWRDKLHKEHPNHSAAKTAPDPFTSFDRVWLQYFQDRGTVEREKAKPKPAEQK